MALPDADLERTRQALEDLVTLRNDLVHHFIQRQDLSSVEGCRAARDSLIATRDLIRRHNDEARVWAEDLDRTRAAFAKALMDEQNLGLIIGGETPRDHPDLSDTGIVRALSEAAGELAVGGLTPVEEAAHWIAARYPAEQPQAYGCDTWAKVVVESGVFELLVGDPEGRRIMYYRESAKPEGPNRRTQPPNGGQSRCHRGPVAAKRSPIKRSRKTLSGHVQSRKGHPGV